MTEHAISMEATTLHAPDVTAYEVDVRCSCDLSVIVLATTEEMAHATAHAIVAQHHRLTDPCSCPDIDVSTSRDLGDGHTRTVRGYVSTCSVHGLDGTQPLYRRAGSS
jgi:hypothetical protein